MRHNWIGFTSFSIRFLVLKIRDLFDFRILQPCTVMKMFPRVLWERVSPAIAEPLNPLKDCQPRKPMHVQVTLSVTVAAPGELRAPQLRFPGEKTPGGWRALHDPAGYTWAGCAQCFLWMTLLSWSRICAWGLIAIQLGIFQNKTYFSTFPDCAI